MSLLLNSEFEIGLRILLILNNSEKTLSVGQIAAIDFITVYGKDFGVSDFNLHGDNRYRFSEYTARRELINRAMKKLVLNGYVQVKYLKSGFFYSIDSTGEDFCNSLNNNYARFYNEIIKSALRYVEGKSERAMAKEINDFSISALTGGEVHG